MASNDGPAPDASLASLLTACLPATHGPTADAARSRPAGHVARARRPADAMETVKKNYWYLHDLSTGASPRAQTHTYT